MTFNDNANIGGGRVSKRGRNTGIAVGGGGLGVIALFLLSQFLGVDLTGLAGGQPAAEPGSVSNLAECTTGAQANADVECLMKGAAASLDTYWAEELPRLGVAYQQPQPVALFTDSTGTGCGAASAATGPFYCPPDATIYLDTAFFDDLRTRFGSSGGPLAEMYVVAHEWGHHVQNLVGTLQTSQDGQTGAASNSVRVELQADCFAGAWTGAATTTRDDNGVTFLKPITQAQLRDALSAASAVGDDRIQAATQGQVNPEGWTHGSSEQRQRWFSTGLDQGAGACDTFAPSDAEL
ncbi:putative metalloprotease [Cryobacterium sp. MP_M5]|uniref:KPN_02809 family neutral zinc metallopeptidase n=1 Tax=unclassified Cryobacterium TaxID=2649013 RepID=UPI0018CAEF32|nr:MULTISPECIES: neutral zinc metallopeptidase [unclassified Cryobacterium]MBG6059426.1 putative metalloprotease [Cryobacterium sp. MP_M3]MEC5177595.1 putative metalloprotease [Cryobacterium sp. MP_M5]